MLWNDQQNMDIPKEAKLLTKQLVKSYEEDKIEIVEGLLYSQYETLRRIEFYWNSKQMVLCASL